MQELRIGIFIFIVDWGFARKDVLANEIIPSVSQGDGSCYLRRRKTSLLVLYLDLYLVDY